MELIRHEKFILSVGVQQCFVCGTESYCISTVIFVLVGRRVPMELSFFFFPPPLLLLLSRFRHLSLKVVSKTFIIMIVC